MAHTYADAAGDRRWEQMRADGDVTECSGSSCQREVLVLSAVHIDGEPYCERCGADLLDDLAYGLACEAFGADADVQVTEHADWFTAAVPGAPFVSRRGVDRVDSLEQLVEALRFELSEQRRRVARGHTQDDPIARYYADKDAEARHLAELLEQRKREGASEKELRGIRERLERARYVGD